MRMIDADALRDKLQEEIDKAIPPFDDVIGSIRCGVRLARNIVEDEPTVDAMPVRHGKWIKGSETKRIKENRYGVLFDAYYCSACESEAYWDSDYGQILFHYCPNCGARMDEE